MLKRNCMAARSARNWQGLAVALAMCSGPAPRFGGDLGKGAVYMMQDQPGRGEPARRCLPVTPTSRACLNFPVFYPTGGLGAGTGLGSQGSIAVDAAGDTLYLVNLPASGSISVFDLSKKGAGSDPDHLLRGHVSD